MRVGRSSSQQSEKMQPFLRSVRGGVKKNHVPTAVSGDARPQQAVGLGQHESDGRHGL
ncbi:hypothetical protein CGRA01v4_01714 [Colletotrichum graminicola]|nr:hypothetical protein CGRA01v4_01714 [Colletotrichum graminicola]